MHWPLPPDEVELNGVGIDGSMTLRIHPRALVICSAVERWFCAGANIMLLETMTEESIGSWVRRGSAVFQKLAELPIPTIAKVDGYTLGGGLELAIGLRFYCSWRIGGAWVRLKRSWGLFRGGVQPVDCRPALVGRKPSNYFSPER